MKRADAAQAGRIPPGQTLTAKWPVLTYGLTPRVDLTRWTFRCFGLVEREMAWTWDDFQKLPRVTVRSDIHCVTRWSKLDNEWEGVPARYILEQVRPRPEARWVLQHADPWQEERYSDQETRAMQQMRAAAARTLRDRA